MTNSDKARINGTDIDSSFDSFYAILSLPLHSNYSCCL